MTLTALALALILSSGLLVFGLLCAVQSFGRMTRRVVESNARTRQSCETSAQRVARSEQRIAEVESETIEFVRELMKAYTERSA